jgi:hypothetical protein
VERCCERSELKISMHGAVLCGVVEIKVMGASSKGRPGASEQPLEQDHSRPLTRRGARLTQVIR